MIKLSISVAMLPAFSLAGFALLYAVYRIGKRAVRNACSPLQLIQGPPMISYMFGSVDSIPEADAYRLFERWSRIWGPTFKYYTVLGVRTLLLTA